MISNDSFASYDDSGKAGHKSCYVLESGIYDFYVGNSVRNCEKAYSFTLESTVVTAELSEVMAGGGGSASAKTARLNALPLFATATKSLCQRKKCLFAP